MFKYGTHYRAVIFTERVIQALIYAKDQLDQMERERRHVPHKVKRKIEAALHDIIAYKTELHEEPKPRG